MKKNRSLKILKKDGVDNAVAYWLEKTPEERLSAVELLREQYYVIQGFKTVPRIEKKLTVVERVS